MGPPAVRPDSVSHAPKEPVTGVLTRLLLPVNKNYQFPALTTRPPWDILEVLQEAHLIRNVMCHTAGWGWRSAGRGAAETVAEVRRAWVSDWGCKSPTEPVGGNREPEATARDESIRPTDRIHLCREAVWDGSPRRTVVPNASEPLCRLAWPGQVCLPTRSPISDRGQASSGGGDRGTLLTLTPGDLHESVARRRR